MRNSLAEITTSNNIEVVGRKTDLPEELRGGDDFQVKAVVDPKTGRIYVVADAVSQGELAGLAAHEVGVHERQLGLNQPKSRAIQAFHKVASWLGLRQMLGDNDFNDVLQQMQRMRQTSKPVRELWDC